MANPTKPDTFKPLTLEQENALDLLVLGCTDGEVAAQISVTRQTVCDWRNHHAVFVAELNRRRREAWQVPIGRLLSLVTEAVDALAADLNQRQDMRLRQNAAVQVLKLVGFYRTDLVPRGKTDPRRIARDWALDQRLDNLGL